MYYPPAVIYSTQLGKYALAFGTGDRENLWAPSAVTGRFYVILDDNLKDKYVAIFGGGMDLNRTDARGNYIYMVDIETGLVIYKRQVTGSVPSEVAAVDVARCLVRKPDVLIVERALDGLSEAKASVARLRRALVGRGLILVTPELSQAMDTPLFDAILRFDRGSATVEDRRKYTAARPMQAPEPVAQVRTIVG